MFADLENAFKNSKTHRELFLGSRDSERYRR